MDELSILLSRFYKREGNRVVFSNGMTMNQLSLEMWSYLGNQGFDVSILSKVVNGKRLFSYDQLNAFSKILDIKNFELVLLKKSLMAGVLSKFSLYDDFNSIFDFSKFSAPSFIANLRRKGEISAAVLMAEEYEEKLIKLFKYSKEKIIYHTIASLLIEKNRVILDFSTSKNIGHLSNILNKKIIKISYQINDQFIYSEAIVNLGVKYYIEKKWQKSLETFSLQKVYTKSSFLRSTIISLLNYAYLKDKYSFNKIRKSAEKIILNSLEYDSVDIFSLLEAISRGLAILGYFNESLHVISKIKDKSLNPFCFSQLVRYELYFHFLKQKHESSPSDFDFVLIKKANDSRISKFTRHSQQIKSLLKKEDPFLHPTSTLK